MDLNFGNDTNKLIILVVAGIAFLLAINMYQKQLGKQVSVVLSVLVLNSILISQSSNPIGWQKGISSWVFFAAITPAIIAVENTGPFAVLISPLMKRSLMSDGNIIFV